MSEIITKLVVDTSLPLSHQVAQVIPLTAEELAQRELDAQAELELRTAREAEEAAKAEAKASAVSKLSALGLTEAEIAALTA